MQQDDEPEVRAPHEMRRIVIDPAAMTTARTAGIESAAKTATRTAGMEPAMTARRTADVARSADATAIVVGRTLAISRANELERYCPVCGRVVLDEKCKVVCRSESCLYRVIYTCSEF